MNAVPLYRSAGAWDEAMGWLADNIRNVGWLIYYTHDVRDQPTAYGATPELLRRCVAAAVEAGCTVLTVERALARIRGAVRPEAPGLE